MSPIGGAGNLVKFLLRFAALPGTILFLRCGPGTAILPFWGLTLAGLLFLVFLIRDRKWSRSILTLLVYALLVFGRLGPEPDPAAREEERVAALRTAEERVESFVMRQVDLLSARVNGIARDPELKEIFQNDPGRREKERLFDLIERYGRLFDESGPAEEIAIDLYGDRDRAPLAWWGDVPGLAEEGESRLTRIAADPSRLHLVVDAPVQIQGRRTPVGFVRISQPIGIIPELNDYLGRPVPFSRLLGEQIGGEVRFFPPGSKEGYSLRLAGGGEIGRAFVDIPFLDADSGRAEKWSAAGLLLLVLWIVSLPWRTSHETVLPDRKEGNLRRSIRRTPVGSIWAVRVLLLFFDFPAWIGLRESLSGPEFFASPFLAGAFRSPADLLLTSAALFLTFLMLRERAVEADRVPGERKSVRLAPLALILLLLSAVTIGFGRLMNEILLSTNLPLFSDPNPLGPLPTMAVELSVFLIGSAYLLLVDAGFVRAIRYGAIGTEALSRRGMTARVTIGTLFAAAVLGLSWIGLCGGAWVFLAPVTTIVTGLLLLFMLRGRGWRVWNGFGFVLAVAIVLYSPVHVSRESMDRVRLEERALSFSKPNDEWKLFLLEEALRYFESDNYLKDKLSGDPVPEMEREAFLAWMRSGLSIHEFSVEVWILDRQGAVVSRFAMDMPAGSPVRSAFIFRDVRASGEKQIYRERRGVGRETVDVYSGAAPLFSDENLVGAIVVSIPCFYQNLAYASDPPAVSRRIFRNFEEGRRAAADREEAPQIFHYNEEGRLVDSSGDRSPDEATLDSTLVAAIERDGSAWGTITLTGERRTALYVSSADPDRRGVLALAFPRAGPLDRVLSFVDLVLTGFFLAVSALFLILLILMAGVLWSRGARFPGMEPSFQDKLVIAFLVVALLPAVLLGVVVREIVADKFQKDGEKEMMTALDAVGNSLGQDVIREAEELAQSTLVRRRVLGIAEEEEVVDLELSMKRFAIFSTDGDLILQNGKIGQVNHAALREVREQRTPLTAFESTEGFSLVALVGISMEGVEERLDGILLLSQPVDEERTVSLGERVGRDISFYEDGSLHSSTRRELYQAGVLSPRLPPDVYAPLELKGKKVRIDEQTVAPIPFPVGYSVLRDFDGRPAGTLGVPLYSLHREAARSMERAYAAITYLMFFIVVVIVVVAELMGRRIARPIGELSIGMDRISSGELELALPVRSGGEIGKLVAAFNRMARRLKLSQDELTERTRYIETVLGSIGAGVMTFNSELKVVSVNRACSQILKVPLHDMEGERLDRAAGGYLKPLHEIASGLRADTDLPVEEEVELSRADEKMTVRVVATAITDEEGVELGKVIVFEDLTELIRSKKLLAWGEMARQVAHEIKNPLTPMKLSVQHLKQAFHDGHDRFPELLDESADLIIEEIDSLQRIATEFSTFARMPRREIRAVPAVDIIRETVGLYGERLEEGKVEMDIPADLPVIHVDREELRRLLINLLENAVQATGGKGRIRFEAMIRDGSPVNDAGWDLWEITSEAGDVGRRLEIRVIDDGPGVSDAARGKLFEPYFSTKTNGTGLGLAICRAIMEDYGGSIAIGSTPGKGTAAIVSLPIFAAV